MLSEKTLRCCSKKHPVDFCRSRRRGASRKDSHAHARRHACAVFARFARLVREKRREEVERRNEQANTRARSRARALACTHDTHGARVVGCENRRAKSGQWRAEAGVGGVTHVVRSRPIGAITASGFRVGFPLGAPHSRSRAREMDEREKRRESARASEESAANSREKGRAREETS